MTATELFRSKASYGKGFVEIVIWHVAVPVSPSAHPYKYRLTYVVDAKRVVGYDNERGKGDHKHLHGRERSYQFVSPQQLIDDFMRDIKGIKK